MERTNYLLNEALLTLAVLAFLAVLLLVARRNQVERARKKRGTDTPRQGEEQVSGGLLARIDLITERLLQPWPRTLAGPSVVAIVLFGAVALLPAIDPLRFALLTPIEHIAYWLTTTTHIDPTSGTTVSMWNLHYQIDSEYHDPDNRTIRITIRLAAPPHSPEARAMAGYLCRGEAACIVRMAALGSPGVTTFLFDAQTDTWPLPPRWRIINQPFRELRPDTSGAANTQWHIVRHPNLVTSIPRIYRYLWTQLAAPEQHPP